MSSGLSSGRRGETALRPPAWLALAVATIILFARDPAHVLHAELWAEDGWVWYPNAYHMGFRSLAEPVAGYLQTISRLVALAVQPLPLLWAPAAFAVAALLIQAAPAAFLLSRRMDQAWPDRLSRTLFALLYLALPNSTEVYVNLTNSQWHLGVLAFLVLMATPPASKAQWAHDIAVLLVSGLSGPFCVLLLPIAAVRAWAAWDRDITARAAIVLLTAAIQAGHVLFTVHQRSMAPLGAGPRLFARLVVQQVMFGALFGQAVMPELIAQPLWLSNVLPVAAAVAGLALVIVALLYGPPILRYFLAFAAAVLAGALARPQADMTQPQWTILAIPGVGGRYWYIPMIAWLGVLFALVMVRIPRAPWLRAAAAVLLCAVVVGVHGDFRFPQRPTTTFAEQALLFDSIPSGTPVWLPVLPLGAQPMLLIKR